MRRRFPLRNVSAACLLALSGFAGFVALGGCADLSEMDEGTCGNGVVESGEDCDRFPDGQCLPAGEKNACRLHCTADAQGVRPACPTGWGCGTDDLCRQPTGKFQAAAWLPIEGGAKLATGDFDGDKRQDLAFTTLRELVVTYLDSDGKVADSLRWFSPLSAPPPVGQLTTEPSPDDVVLQVDGLTVLVGDLARTLRPTAYAPFNVEATSARVLVMDAMPLGSDAEDPSLWAGDEIIVIAGGMVSNIGEKSTGLMDMSAMEGEFAGDPLVGRIDKDWPCEYILLNFKGASALPGYSPCTASAGWNQGTPGDVVDVPIHLPEGWVVATAALFADVNVDGFLDVVVGAAPAGKPNGMEPLVAFGVGDRAFHSGPPEELTGEQEPDRHAGFALLDIAVLGEVDQDGKRISGVMPLAIGDLNKDGFADFVMPDGVWVSIVGWSVSLPNPVDADGGPEEQDAGMTEVSYGRLAQNAGLPWDQAVIADFNDNGFLDVVAGSTEARGITFLNGTGSGLFNEFWIPTRGYPGHFTVGDFDGDLLPDLAFAETKVPWEGGADPGDALSIAFGQGFGGPSAPVTMGYLGRIEQIAAGSMSVFYLDDIDDLIVVSRPDDKPESKVSIAALGGMSDRQLLSTYSLFHNFSQTDRLEMSPWLVTVGEFDGRKDHKDLAAIGVRFDERDSSIAAEESRLWLIPSTGEAALDSARDRPSDPLPFGFVGSQAAIAPIDLDGDGIDEVLVLGTELELVAVDGGETAKLNGRAFLARRAASETGDFFDVQDLGVTERLYWQAVSGLSLEALLDAQLGGSKVFSSLGKHPGTHVLVGNVGGDHRKEVVVLAYDLDMETFALRTYVQVIGQDGAGGLDMGGVVTLPLDPALAPKGIALANLDGDEEMELLFVTEQEAYVADVGDGSLRNLRVLEGVSGGYAITAADLTGDGLVDLAVSREGGVQVYRGLAVNP